MAVPDARSSRIEPRIPFFTPVVASRLQRCWATNISSGGIGLTGFVAGVEVPEPGDELELEFVVGGTKESIRALGHVAWTGVVRPDRRLGLGVQFRDVSTTARAALALFLADHRPRVIVAMASPQEAELVRRALGHVQLEFVERPDELNDEFLQACASIVVFARDADQLTSFVEVASQFASSNMVPGELPLAPITLCTDVSLERILPLFTDGKTYEVFRPPFDRRALTAAVERNCKQWALQLELRWASLQLEGLAHRRRSEPRRPPEPTGDAPNIIRVSAPMQRAYELMRTVAVHDVPVLLAGETGTGKELAAREIHMLSKRAHTPFIAQDCGALSETLLESELFGHVRGAFTGAVTDHAGLFQIAHGGTIFLDEIQNTSPTLQAKLLRVVEMGEVRPVGGSKPQRVDVRLIVASNVDLRQAVKEQRFRSDFFYRLNRFPIELPPLRHHIEDILPLTRHFLQTFCAAQGRSLHRIDPRVESTLVAYDWPGNIRELKNVIERSLLLTPIGEPLRWETLPAEVRGGVAVPESEWPSLEAQVQAFERRIIQTAVDRNAGIVRRAARELQVNAVTLSRRMRRLGLIE